MDKFSPKISVIGLGYVGLPVAVHMSRVFEVVGFDLNQKRIAELKERLDRTDEVSPEELNQAKIFYTSDFSDLESCNFHIVAVPTPVDKGKTPDLSALFKASESVGRVLKKGDIVVYESTVYPGATEDDCCPVLEKFSGLQSGVDFKVGYSPERINPGDKNHSFDKITKVVSGQDADCLDKIAHVYGAVVTAGVYKATSIKVAEAAKVIENTQRDVNIALMNELAMIFRRMDISTSDVLAAAATKWNFLQFVPGLVGGHCIGVDPYYLTYKAQQLGYHPEMILAGRQINDGMGKYFANQVIKHLIRQGFAIKGQKINVFGLTFKENCPDLRNTKVVDIINELRDFGAEVYVTDPLASHDEAMEEYNIELIPAEKMPAAIATIVAVSHQHYQAAGPDAISSEVVFDLKNTFAEYSGSKQVVRL